MAEVSDHLATPGHTVWFDICPPQTADLRTIQEELGLHDLAVEDVLQPGQRSKLDQYPEHLFMVTYALDLETGTGRLEAHEVGVFITSNALVTVRADEGFAIDKVTERWDSMPQLASSGVAFLLHGILDYAIDTQLDVVQALDAQIDGLEDQLFDDVTSDAALQRRAFEIRRSLVTLRRLVLPMPRCREHPHAARTRGGGPGRTAVLPGCP